MREWLRKGLRVEFNTTSLILPSLIEILINLLLVGWFKVDGFSTSMVARKGVRRYIVGNKESGFAANAFLSRGLVKSEDKNVTLVYHVFHVLTFQGSFVRLISLSYITCTINLMCAAIWVVFTGIKRFIDKWYVNSEVSSKPRVPVIVVAIGFSLGMDYLHLYLGKMNKTHNALTGG